MTGQEEILYICFFIKFNSDLSASRIIRDQDLAPSDLVIGYC